MTKSYKFTIGSHDEQAHDYVGELIDEAYKGGTTAEYRTQQADYLCEEHFRQVDVMPDSSVLTRLAWYLVFDEMTDTHPDKMSREEYPILSRWQAEVRDDRYIDVEEMEYGDRRHKGRRKSSFFGKDGEAVVSTPKLADSFDEEIERLACELDVGKLLKNANLTDRQRQAIDLIYFEDMTRVRASEVMGVTRQAVARFEDAALEKLRGIIGI